MPRRLGMTSHGNIVSNATTVTPNACEESAKNSRGKAAQSMNNSFVNAYLSFFLFILALSLFETFFQSRHQVGGFFVLFLAFRTACRFNNVTVFNLLFHQLFYLIRII